MQDRSNKWGIILRVIPPCITAGLILVFFLYLRNVTFSDIVNLAPDSPWGAAAVLVVIYSIKSMSIVFPLTALYISAGVLFPFWVAILVNLVGLFCCTTIPFWIGRFSGAPLMEKLTEKYPKVNKLSEIGTSNEVFSSYILRAIGILPGDVASAVMGACGYRFPAYTLGSLLGLLPAMIIQTLMGRHLDEPLSPLFIFLFCLLIAVSVISTFCYNRYRKHKHKETNQTK